MKLRILGLTILFLMVSGMACSQGLSLVPYAKLQGGYGLFTGYTEFNFDMQTAGISTEDSRYTIFSGFDYSFSIGTSFLRSGDDIYRDSHFDIFLVHKGISSSSGAARFTGIGAQVRYQFFYGGFIAGMAKSRSELPIAIDEPNNTQLTGNLHGPTPMFTLGLRAPVNSAHTLFIDVPFDFVIPRNRPDDDPVGSAALFEWYSLGLGICYFLQLEK